jgi:hypothetical protein
MNTEKKGSDTTTEIQINDFSKKKVLKWQIAYSIR